MYRARLTRSELMEGLQSTQLSPVPTFVTATLYGVQVVRACSTDRQHWRIRAPPMKPAGSSRRTISQVVLQPEAYRARIRFPHSLTTIKRLQEFPPLASLPPV